MLNKHPIFVRVVNKILFDIFMIIIAFIFTLPLLWMITTAFKTPQQIVAFPPKWIPNPWTLRSFVEGFSSHSIPHELYNSMVLSLLSVIGTLFSSSLVGFGFARIKMRYKNIIFMMIRPIICLYFPANRPIYFIYLFMNIHLMLSSKNLIRYFSLRSSKVTTFSSFTSLIKFQTLFSYGIARSGTLLTKAKIME